MKNIKNYDSFLNEEATMDMKIFMCKDYDNVSIIIGNYDALVLEGEISEDLEQFEGVINLILENKDDISKITSRTNKYPKGDTKSISWIKFETDSYNKQSDYVKKFISFLSDTLDVKSERYSPHGVTPYWEVELSTPIEITF